MLKSFLSRLLQEMLLGLEVFHRFLLRVLLGVLVGSRSLGMLRFDLVGVLYVRFAEGFLLRDSITFQGFCKHSYKVDSGVCIT